MYHTTLLFHPESHGMCFIDIRRWTIWYVANLVHNSNETINIGWLALRFEIYFGATITSIILTLAVTNQKMLINAIENIIKIDKEMDKIGIKVTYVNAQRFSYFQILGISCVFSTKLILQAFSARAYYKFVYNTFNVVDYLNTIMLFQYVDILLLLRQRYIWLNREIRNTPQRRYEWNSLTTDKKLYSVVDIANAVTPKILVKRWGKLHGELFTTAMLVNRAYGVQLLSTICARFIMITTQLINVYKSIQDPNQSDANTYTLMAIYLFLHGSKIFMVASISENTAAKRKSDTTVSDIETLDDALVHALDIEAAKQAFHISGHKLQYGYGRNCLANIS
ncbi:hypothetical protein FQR65_LT15115 [Abscondita terminalis]|nr:hypothetical protein FQR65_LT15115 [Abscondita terminalis]